MLGGMVATLPAWAGDIVDLNLGGGPNRRDLTTGFPQKAQMILQRTRPPLLETPFEVFDRRCAGDAAARIGGSQSMLRQLPRDVPATRNRRPMGERGHGKCAVDRHPLARRAGSRWRQD